MKLAVAVNFIARSLIIFILSYLWLSFYIREIVVVFVISFCIIFFVNLLFHLVSKHRNARAELSRKQQEHLRKVTLQLKFQSLLSTLEYLKVVFESLGKSVKTTTKKLIVIGDNSKINLFPLFNVTPKVDDVVACVKATTRDAKTYIAAEFFGPEVAAFAKTLDLPIKLITSVELYAQILAPANIFPEITVNTKSHTRLTLTALKQMVFHRSKVRTYVFFALIIFAASFIVRFSIYYIIAASVLFLLALLSMFALPSKSEIF